jgi:hypothetical protein
LDIAGAEELTQLSIFDFQLLTFELTTK